MSLLALQAAVASIGGRAFGPFDLTIAACERIAILGPSGAGKSTLLKLMAGEHAVHRGAVRVDGRDLAAFTPSALALRRAVVAQSHAVAFPMPVELVVALGRMTQADDGRIVREALAAAHAAHLQGRRFDTLSGGEQARVQLARSMAQLWDARGALLFVDEPLAALDPGLQFDLMDALQRFARERGHALVAVLHDINQALAGFDRLWLVERGRVTHDIAADRHALPHLEALFALRLRPVDTDDGGLAVLAGRRV